jgi:hypothetical protein
VCRLHGAYPAKRFIKASLARRPENPQWLGSNGYAAYTRLTLPTSTACSQPASVSLPTHITGSNSNVASGFDQSQVGNPNAKWEVTQLPTSGFEALLWKGKLDVIVDLWQKRTSDLLFNPALANVLGGFASAPFKNVAEMLNKGVDIQLVNKGKIASEVGYELTLTGSALHNEIVKIDEGLITSM